MIKPVSHRRLLAAAVSAMLMAPTLARAAANILITEVDPSGSSATSNTYNADWFELTNTGDTAQNITGWKIDDNSHAFASAVAFRGVTSIAPGQSVVFVEGTATGTTDSTIDTNFENFWFGAGNVPAGFIIGNYGGTGVGLSGTADEVNIYDALGNEVTGVGFGAATTGVSFDNAAGVGSSTQPDLLISTNSAVGTNGAFSSFNAAAGQPNEIGSPGVIAAVPEPASLALLALGALGLVARRRAGR